MPQFKVLLADPRPNTDRDWIDQLESASSLAILSGEETETVDAHLAEAEAIVVQNRPVDAKLMDRAPNLRLIQRYGSRPDGIDLQAASRRDIRVAAMPLRGCIAVAELATTLILALSKNLIEAHRATVTGAYRDRDVEPIRTEQRRHNFQWMQLPGLLEVNGHTLGIIGFGEIGTETARRARALGMKVLYNKRTRLPAEIEEMEEVTFASKEDLLRQSDFVLLSTPLTPETEAMIGAAELKMMKTSAFLVNICRGGVIDEEALVSALNDRTIAGAGLDVFVYEPIPHDHPLLRCDNVILTPHIGGGTGGARDKQMNDVLANVLAFARGEGFQHHVKVTQ